jgi:hypothetical protein
MDEKQTQQETQADSTPQEGQRPVSHGEANRSRTAQRGPMAQHVSHCANCDIEFFWSPTVRQGNIYCCAGCAAGGPCNCDYSLYRSVTIMGVVHYEQ